MMKILRRLEFPSISVLQETVQEIRADGRDPNFEDPKKMVRGAAEENQSSYEQLNLENGLLQRQADLNRPASKSNKGSNERLMLLLVAFNRRSI